jgi:hypothetical protein
MQQTLK